MRKTLTDYPELLKEWHQERNEDLYPENIKFKSNKKVWWRCFKNHEWIVSVRDRTRGRGCSYCAGQKACFSNCLATLYPEITKEWHLDKNSISPNDVVPQSSKRVWWKCNEGHKWQAIISNRTTLSNKCPYCYGQKVCCSNSLATLRIDVAKEWHPTKNTLTPFEVTVKSGKKVWWQCAKAHEWQAVISQRTSYNSGCPSCNQSKGEKRIKEFLEIKNLNFIPQIKFDDCKHKSKLPFDFLVMITELKKFLIEYNGEHHYKLVKWRGSNHVNERASLGSIKFRDKIKQDWCDTNNIPLLIIPYWEFKNIEKIIIDFIINIQKGILLPFIPPRDL